MSIRVVCGRSCVDPLESTINYTFATVLGARGILGENASYCAKCGISLDSIPVKQWRLVVAREMPPARVRRIDLDRIVG